MKSDLDLLMQEHNMDALLVVGPGQHNPAMVYLTGGAHLTSAFLIKKRGSPPVLFYNSMERDEAAKSGFRTINLDTYRLQKPPEKTDNDGLHLMVSRFQMMFKDAGLSSGRVAICGQSDAGMAFAVFSALQAASPDMTLVGEAGEALLLQAMATKDSVEVERIRRVGQTTVAVVGQVADFLTSHRVKDGILIKHDGSPLTIGEVKNQINLWLAERGAENAQGLIFSSEYDAAVPHSTGSSSNLLRLGKTIIFDIYPCELGGGYFYDLTRTWCLGYAPDGALALYEDVLDVYNQVTYTLKPGIPFRTYQELACEVFKARGHVTIQENPLTEEGYVHNLGHGVGLHVHEKPFSRHNSQAEELLEPGVVFTVEPGLYYPQRNLGVRLENTLWMRPNGQVEILAEYPLDLILPMK